MSMAFIPEKRQELHESIPKTCKLKALDAQQGGLFGVDKLHTE